MSHIDSFQHELVGLFGGARAAAEPPRVRERRQRVTGRARAVSVAALALALALVACAPAWADDGAAVRDVWAELDAAWTARDADRFSALFTAGASFVFVDRGHSMDGRDAIRAHFTDQFPRIAPEYSHRTEIASVRSVADRTVLADGVVRVSRAGEAYRSFDLVAVMVRGDDGWDIAVLRVFDRP